MNWILEHIFQVGALLFVVISIVRGIRNAREASQGNERTAGSDETDEQRRVREIQERIRRKIAERRGGHPAQAPGSPFHPAQTEPPPLVVRRETHTPPSGEVFAGPLKRALEEIERKLQPPTPPPLQPHFNRAEVERQEQLAEQVRVLEQERVQVARRAAHRAAEQAETARTGPARRTVMRGHLLDDLHDPNSLRRAFVLREVLGPPVGLR